MFCARDGHNFLSPVPMASKIGKIVEHTRYIVIRIAVDACTPCGQIANFQCKTDENRRSHPDARHVKWVSFFKGGFRGSVTRDNRTTFRRNGRLTGWFFEFEKHSPAYDRML